MGDPPNHVNVPEPAAAVFAIVTLPDGTEIEYRVGNVARDYVDLAYAVFDSQAAGNIEYAACLEELREWSTFNHHFQDGPNVATYRMRVNVYATNANQQLPPLLTQYIPSIVLEAAPYESFPSIEAHLHAIAQDTLNANGTLIATGQPIDTGGIPFWPGPFAYAELPDDSDSD